MTLKALAAPIAVHVGPGGFSVSGVTTVLSDGTLPVVGSSRPNNQLYFEHLSGEPLVSEVPSVGFSRARSTILRYSGK